MILPTDLILRISASLHVQLPDRRIALRRWPTAPSGDSSWPLHPSRLRGAFRRLNASLPERPIGSALGKGDSGLKSFGGCNGGRGPGVSPRGATDEVHAPRERRARSGGDT